ncbi:hypothetical protein [Halostella sp. PRR32]|uniref:hypothetical protein n=1 Tax=Halostella sp. PRR32 TaxID=3098147 RepID=UPI00110DE621|nr:hypothetical protein [Halostella sp. PRR32]
MNQSEPMRKLVEGDWFDLLFDSVVQSLGEGTFAMFVVGIIVIPIYSRTGDASLPAILLTLFAGTLIPMLPGGLSRVAWGVFWIAGAIAVLGLIQRFR